MARSFVTEVANGSTNRFSVPFPYLQRSHVVVTINGVPQLPNTYFWPSAGEIQFFGPSADLAGKAVGRRRYTPAAPLVTFEAGQLDNADLNTSARQALYRTEETEDALDSVTLRLTGAAQGRVVYVQAGIDAGAEIPGLVYRTIAGALAFADTLPLNPNGPGDVSRCTIIGTGTFDEQFTLPTDVTLKGSGFGQFNIEWTGDRSVRNWTCKLGYGNWLQDVRFWLTGDPTHETVWADDTSRYFGAINVHWLTRFPPGGSALDRGPGHARCFSRVASVWPFTGLLWNCLINSHGEFNGNDGPIRLINISPSEGSAFADFRTWNLNVDGLYVGTGCLIYQENLKDCWHMNPQFLANRSSTGDALLRIRRTNSAGSPDACMTHLIGGVGTGWTAPHEVNSGCAISFESHGTEGGPVRILGDGFTVGTNPEGGLVFRRGVGTFPTSNLPIAPASTANGLLRVAMAGNTGVMAPRAYYAVGPWPAGQRNAHADLINENHIIDDFYQYGIIIRNPTTRQAYLFGIRSGQDLALSLWESPSEGAPLNLLNGNVRPSILYRNPPRRLGVFRQADNTVRFEVRGADDANLFTFHTLPSLGAFTQIGVGVGDENAAGSGPEIRVLLNSFTAG